MSRTPGLAILDAVADVPDEDWNALAGPRACLSHAFLHALESSASVGPGTGWQPAHLLLRNGDAPYAAAPLYMKQHSYGEYVFDWAWADAYARNGLAYYPKLVCALPFTPLPGQRLLGHDDTSRQRVLDAMLSVAEASEVSSLHILFPETEEAGWMLERGLLIRDGVQFHWFNRGYRDFADFLAHLNNDKRKKIRQERRRAQDLGLTLRWLDGRKAGTADWAFFHRCYARTYALHRSTPYLTPRFFTELAQSAPDNVRLLIGARDEQPVAGAFFLCDQDALYGRYWGALEHLPFLHFELCYYQAIEYCIDHGIGRFEGGAQGEHKLSRGLEPVPTRSAHWIRDPRFHDAVDRFLARERQGMQFYLDELAERSPLRQNTVSS